MAVLSIIVGAIITVGGIICFFTPFATFMAAGYIIGIMLFIYGIIALIRSIQKRAGVPAYITSALAIFVGFLAVFRPGGTLVIDMLILVFIAIWFIVQGATSIYISIKRRKELPGWGKRPYIGFGKGTFGLAAGVLSFIFPQVEMFAVGILMAIFLIEAGISLITVGSIYGDIEQ